MPLASSVCSTPICAHPRAAPPPKAMPSFGRCAGRSLKPSAAEPADDGAEVRAWPILRLRHRGADIDEAGDLLVGGEAECIERAAIVGVPFGDPVAGKAERMRGVEEV